MLETDILPAVLLGLAGSTHCVFMCGGIHGALLSSSRVGIRLMPFFNMGRLASYALAGLLVGSVGLALQSLQGFVPVARLLSGLILLLMAAYVSRWWSGLAVLEKLGAPVWKIIQPFASQLLPVKSASGALGAGALWGWLPCGLIYSALAWSMLAESPAHSALRMFCFGVGTLPALFGSGLLAERMAALLKSRMASNINATLLVIFALWTMLPAIQHMTGSSAHGSAHHHEQQHSQQQQSHPEHSDREQPFEPHSMSDSKQKQEEMHHH